MQEINEENIDELVNQTNDADSLKELILYAVAMDREDLIETILDKSIKNNKLVEKLQQYELSPVAISFLGDDHDEEHDEDSAEDDEEHEDDEDNSQTASEPIEEIQDDDVSEH